MVFLNDSSQHSSKLCVCGPHFYFTFPFTFFPLLMFSLFYRWTAFHLKLNRCDICFAQISTIFFNRHILCHSVFVYMYIFLLSMSSSFNFFLSSGLWGFCRCPCAVGDGGGRVRREGADVPTPAPHALNAAIGRRLEPSHPCAEVKPK